MRIETTTPWTLILLRSLRHHLFTGLAALAFIQLPQARADLDETKKAIETRYTERNKETRSEAAVTPAAEMVEFNLAYVSNSGKYARVWFKDGQSVMESHIAV